jgi:hypothetical protein
MIKWDKMDPLVTITRAYPCTINRGIINENRICLDLPAQIYVDDALMLTIDRAHMEMVLAAAIEAIFLVMGEPKIAVMQCPLAMDKWLELVIGLKQTMLGLIIDTNKLTISIPYKHLKEVLDILNFTWHPNRCCLKVSKAQKFTGKLAWLTEGENWVFHLLSHLYSLIVHALSKNRKFLMESSCEFQDIIKNLRTGAFLIHCKDLARHALFAMKRAAKMMHHALYRNNINKTICHELKFFRDKLKTDLGINWETPIAHLIPHTPFATTIGNSSLN